MYVLIPCLPPSLLGKTNHHEGNKKLRRLVSMYKKDYLCAKKLVKRHLVSRIVRFVRQGRGRFLQKEKDGFWYEIGDVRACAKLSQSMREGASVASICREMIGNAPPRADATKDEDSTISRHNSPRNVPPSDASHTSGNRN
jgi:hypothetical protein